MRVPRSASATPCAVRALAQCAFACVLIVGGLLGNFSRCRAQEAPAPSTVVLDSLSFWRIYQTVRPQVADVDGEIKPIEVPWPEWERYSPPDDWTSPDFDDRAWPRSRVRLTAYDSQLARLCMRGKFSVSDPEKVGGLTVSLAYHGGAIVYVNGREVARAHIAEGADVGESYPPEAFLAEDGDLARYVGVWNARGIDRNDTVRLMRRRVLENVEIPAGLLREGVNVLALEIVRAPYSKEVFDYTLKNGNDKRYRWPTCMLYGVELTAAQADGLTPNARRPDGFQVWNQDLLASDFAVDWGDRT